MAPMTAIEYARLLSAGVNKFAEYWQRDQISSPDSYPETMETGEWDEQFLSFIRHQKGECDERS